MHGRWDDVGRNQLSWTKDIVLAPGQFTLVQILGVELKDVQILQMENPKILEVPKKWPIVTLSYNRTEGTED